MSRYCCASFSQIKQLGQHRFASLVSVGQESRPCHTGAPGQVSQDSSLTRRLNRGQIHLHALVAVGRAQLRVAAGLSASVPAGCLSRPGAPPGTADTGGGSLSVGRCPGPSGGSSSLSGPTHLTPGAPPLVTTTDIPRHGLGSLWVRNTTRFKSSGVCSWH